MPILWSIASGNGIIIKYEHAAHQYESPNDTNVLGWSMSTACLFHMGFFRKPDFVAGRGYDDFNALDW